jgi:hypothetical protein
MCVVAGTVGAAVAGGVASSATGSLLSGGNSGAQGAANAADPFSSQRGQYQQMLSQLINNPSSITSNPGYEFGLQESNKAVEGSAAANGMVNSGNVLQALSTNSQQYASQQLNNQELLLAQLSGANIGSPGTAGQILQGQNTANQTSAGALGSQVGSAVTSGFNSAFAPSTTSGVDQYGFGSEGSDGSNSYGFSSGVSTPVSYGFDV